ncbi:MAG: hypothetical protein NVS9B4_04400 [Candidatus Acidiferrum sp.]
MVREPKMETIKKRTTHWILGLAGVFVALLLTAGLIFHSQSFHNYVLSKIIGAAHDATGGRVEVSSYVFRIAPLRLDLYNIVIHGTEGPAEKALARVDHLGITLKILSVLRRKVDVREIIADHPQINFKVDARGRSNLPAPPRANSSSTNIFDLAVNHLEVSQGELLYNDRQMVLNADMRDLESKIDFDGLKRQYAGAIAYQDGRVKFGNMSPVEHRLDAAFTVGEAAGSLDHLKITMGASQLSAQAKVNNYSKPVVDGQYQIVISAADVDHLTHDSTLRNGELSTQGSLHYETQEGQGFIDVVLLQGTLASDRLGIATRQVQTDLRSIQGHYKLQNGTLTAPDLQVDLLGGRLNANLSAQHITTVPDVQVRGGIHSVSVESLAVLGGASKAGRPAVTGRTDGRFETNWHGSVSNLQALADVTIAAATTAPRSGAATSAGARSGPIPLNGTLHARYDGPRALLSFRQSYLRTPATVLRFEGTIGNQASLNVQANSTNLHELDLLALSFRNGSSTGWAPLPWGLYGAGQFTGQVTGTTKDPHFAGQLSASNFQVRQSHWQSLRTNLDANSRSVALQHGELVAGPSGQINFDAAVGLSNWSYLPSSPIRANVKASGLQAGELEQLANVHYPISGTVSGTLTLSGSKLEPQGQGVVQVVNARMWDEPVQTAVINFEGTGRSIRTTLKLQSTAGSANSNLVYSPRTEAYEISLDARANNLSTLNAMRAKNIRSQGPIILVARGRGTLKDPELQASLDIPQVTLGRDTISGIKADLKLEQHRGNFNLVSSVSNAAVNAHGTVDLQGEYYANVTLDTRAFPLNPVFAAYFPDNAGVRGLMDLHADLKGPLKEPERIEANVEIPTLKVDYQAIHLANSGPIRANYRNGVVQLARSEIKGNDTDLRFEGTVPVRGATSMNVSVRGEADLKLLMLIDKQTDSAGQLSLNLTARGDRAHPNVDGNIRLGNAAYSTPTSPLGVENVNGEIVVANNRFEITQLTGKSGGGDFKVHGYMVYSAKPVFNLGLDAHTIRLRYPDGLRAILNGQLALDGSTEAANLNGSVIIERLSFTQEFDLATFANQFADDTSAPPSEGFANNIELNVAVQSSGNLGLESTKLSLQGDANLRVIGTAARPVITGRTNITDGELFFLNNRYRVERAVLEFANPVRTEPVVNLLATTKVNNFDLSINMVGPIDRLRTNYISDPPLPPVDIINLLTRGTTTEAAAPGNLGANSLIAKGLASQVSSRVGKLAGISSLQIDPLIGGGNRNPSARVAIQEHITKDIIFTYAADVTSTQNELIQVEYQVTPAWSFRVLRDETGSFSIEGRRRKSF